MNTIRPQAELLIVDSIHDKCTQIVAAKEDQLPDGADIRFLSHQMAVIYESGIQALAYNNGDIEAAAHDLADSPTMLHEVGMPMDKVLANLKEQFRQEMDAFNYYFAHKEDEQRGLIYKIKDILKK